MKPNEADDQPGNRVPFRNSVPFSSRVLVLGFGNPLRGDDALGLVAAERLSSLFSNHDHVTILASLQLTWDVAEVIAQYDFVVMIDARESEAIGEIYCYPIHPSEHIPQAFSHYLKPAELLGVCQTLYHSTPVAFLTGINTIHFEVGEPLSPAVSAALPAFIEQAEAIILGLLQK